MATREIGVGAIAVFYKTFQSSSDEDAYCCYYTCAINMGKAREFAVCGAEEDDLLFVPFWFSSKFPRYTAEYGDIVNNFQRTEWQYDGETSHGFIFNPNKPREAGGIRLITILGRWPPRRLQTMFKAASLTETVYNYHTWSASILGLTYAVQMRRDGDVPYFSLIYKGTKVDDLVDKVVNSDFKPEDRFYPLEWYTLDLKDEVIENPLPFFNTWVDSYVETTNRFGDNVSRFDNSLITNSAA